MHCVLFLHCILTAHCNMPCKACDCWLQTWLTAPRSLPSHLHQPVDLLHVSLFRCFNGILQQVLARHKFGADRHLQGLALLEGKDTAATHVHRQGIHQLVTISLLSQKQARMTCLPLTHLLCQSFLCQPTPPQPQPRAPLNNQPHPPQHASCFW